MPNPSPIPEHIRDSFFHFLRFPNAYTQEMVAHSLAQYPALGLAKRDTRGQETALILATLAPSLPLLELIAPHSDPLAQDDSGRNALMWLAGKGFGAGVEYLLSTKTGVEQASARDKRGYTALMSWVDRPYPSRCPPALLRATPLESTRQRQTTPLHLAALCNQADLVEQLLQRAPQQMLALDSSGRSPLQVVLSRWRDGQSAQWVDLFAAYCPMEQCEALFEVLQGPHPQGVGTFEASFPRLHARLERDALRRATHGAAKSVIVKSASVAPRQEHTTPPPDEEAPVPVRHRAASSTMSIKPIRRL